MAQIQFPSDVTGAHETLHGSDGRANVSSRSDARVYYNSRDVGRTFTMSFDDLDAAAGDYVAYLKNTDTNGRQLVIHKYKIASTIAGAAKVSFVTGTAAGGSTITPVNTNKGSSIAASATVLGNSAITGLTEDGVIEIVGLPATGIHSSQADDVIRLGQNDAIAIEWDRGANTILEGTIVFFYE